MAQSIGYKKRMNFMYGMGAAIVIVGALFKIQHFSIGPLTGGVMLTVGLITEAIIFAISAFDSPEEDLDWSKVYPQLATDTDAALLLDESSESEDVEGQLSQKLDALLQEANIDANLMKGFGDSMKNFQGAAEGLASASESIAATNKYNEQMGMATVKMESLNSLYEVQMENANKQSELNAEVVENTQKLKEQMESLAENLSSLNGVYGGMLSVMSNK